MLVEADEYQDMQEEINRIFAIEPPIRWEITYNQINGLNESDVCEWVKDESSMPDTLDEYHSKLEKYIRNH